MIIAAMVAGLLSACGAGKSATSTSGAGVTDGQEQPGLTKAEIDTLQHEAARLAMEQGEFVFQVTRLFTVGIGISATPNTNFLEVTGDRLYFQVDCVPGKEPRRTASKFSGTKLVEDGDLLKMTIPVHSLYCPFNTIYLTLYPGSNKAYGVLHKWVAVEGEIVPRKLSQISKTSKRSWAEIWESW